MYIINVVYLIFYVFRCFYVCFICFVRKKQLCHSYIEEIQICDVANCCKWHSPCLTIFLSSSVVNLDVAEQCEYRIQRYINHI